MEKEQLYNKLFSNFNTITEAHHVINQIDLLIEQLFDTKTSYEDKINTYLENKLKDEILFISEKSGVDFKNANSLQDLLIKIKNEIKKLPIVELRIAFEPNTNTVSHFSDWFYLNLKKKVLLNCTVDPSVIGGAVVGYMGNITDKTAKKKMHELYDLQQF